MEKTYVPAYLSGKVALILIADRGYQTFPSGTYHQGWWVNLIADNGMCLMQCGQSCPPYGDQLEVEMTDLVEPGQYI